MANCNSVQTRVWLADVLWKDFLLASWKTWDTCRTSDSVPSVFSTWSCCWTITASMRQHHWCGREILEKCLSLSQEWSFSTGRWTVYSRRRQMVNKAGVVLNTSSWIKPLIHRFKALQLQRSKRLPHFKVFEETGRLLVKFVSILWLMERLSSDHSPIDTAKIRTIRNAFFYWSSHLHY